MDAYIFGKIRLSGRQLCNLASLRDAGKKIAPDFDLVELDPRCIINPRINLCLPCLLSCTIHFCFEM